MFGRPDYTIREAENLEHAYFEIKIDENAFHDLKIYLDPDKQKNPEQYERCKYVRDSGFENSIFGQHIMQWRDKTGKLSIANIKYNPHNEYQILLQFVGIDKPLKRHSKTRKVLEEFLTNCRTRILRCGYIRDYRGNVFCLYDGKDFTIDEKSLQRKGILEEQKAKIEEQARYIDNLRIANMNR